jgi:hypothetical protein
MENTTERKGKTRLSKLGVALLVLTVLAGTSAAALYNTVSISGTMTIGSNCVFSANTATIAFGSISQGTSVAATFGLLVTNGGNIASNVFVQGAGTALSTNGNWVYANNAFAVGNTVWTGVASQTFATANKLTAAAVDTTIIVPSGGATNTLYWGASAPLYQAPGAYVQSISVTNSC